MQPREGMLRLRASGLQACSRQTGYRKPDSRQIVHPRSATDPVEVPLELEEPEPLLLPDPELEPELPEDDGDGDLLRAMAAAVGGATQQSRQAGASDSVASRCSNQLPVAASKQ